MVDYTAGKGRGAQIPTALFHETIEPHLSNRSSPIQSQPYKGRRANKSAG